MLRSDCSAKHTTPKLVHCNYINGKVPVHVYTIKFFLVWLYYLGYESLSDKPFSALFSSPTNCILCFWKSPSFDQNLEFFISCLPNSQFPIWKMKGIAQSFWNGSPAIPLQSGLFFTKINNNHNTEMKDWPYIDRVWLKTPIENFKKIIIYANLVNFKVYLKVPIS